MHRLIGFTSSHDQKVAIFWCSVTDARKQKPANRVLFQTESQAKIQTEKTVNNQITYTKLHKYAKISEYRCDLSEFWRKTVADTATWPQMHDLPSDFDEKSEALPRRQSQQ